MKKFIIKVWLAYSIRLFSGIEHSDVISIYTLQSDHHDNFSNLCHHTKLLQLYSLCCTLAPHDLFIL